MFTAISTCADGNSVSHPTLSSFKICINKFSTSFGPINYKGYVHVFFFKMIDVYFRYGYNATSTFQWSQKSGHLILELLDCKLFLKTNNWWCTIRKKYVTRETSFWQLSSNCWRWCLCTRWCVTCLLKVMARRSEVIYPSNSSWIIVELFTFIVKRYGNYSSYITIISHALHLLMHNFLFSALC